MEGKERNCFRELEKICLKIIEEKGMPLTKSEAGYCGFCCEEDPSRAVEKIIVSECPYNSRNLAKLSKNGKQVYRYRCNYKNEKTKLS